MLNAMYDFDGAAGNFAVHTPGDLPWDRLPARTVVQLHWRREPAFLNLLAQHEMRVVVLARHPLDVLISILHYARHEPDTSRWLGGAEGDEASILDASPRSESFLRFATGPRGRALLSVSRAWWNDPASLKVHYEDLVRETVATLDRLALGIGVEPVRTATEARSTCSIEKLRSQNKTHHFWQGSPGHWRRFLTAAEAQAIAAAHPECFADLGYAADFDPTLNAADADANWRRVERPRRRAV